MSKVIPVDTIHELLADKLKWLMTYGDDVYVAVGDDIRDVIESIPTAQEWISVKDGLPDEWDKVFAFIPSIDAIVPSKLRGGSWYSTWDTTRLEYVSHWMPMPEKP